MNTLRATRRSCGLTQASVAASAGISLPTLRALERGEGGVRALAAVMAVLDLRWGWAPDRVQAARALADRRRARGLSQAQLDNLPDETIAALQAQLTAQYDSYHDTYGLINSRGTASAFREDSGYFLLDRHLARVKASAELCFNWKSFFLNAIPCHTKGLFN